MGAARSWVGEEAGHWWNALVPYPSRAAAGSGRVPPFATSRSGRVHTPRPPQRRRPAVPAADGHGETQNGPRSVQASEEREEASFAPSLHSALVYFNLLWEYSIEYGNTQLSGPIREAGVAELSGPASAPSLSGSRAFRGYRSLGRQCPSAPPAALQSDNFRPPPEMLEMWRQKRR